MLGRLRDRKSFTPCSTFSSSPGRATQKKKKKNQAVWKKYWKTLKSLFIFYSRKNPKEFSLQTDFCSEFGLFLNPTVWGVMVFLTFLQPLKNTVDGLIQIKCWA